jgi:large conductance mechanosensitive channel
VIIGGAFGKIVDSLVGDLIMPIVGKIFGGLDFSNYFIRWPGQTATVLAEARRPAPCSPTAASSPWR